jgi:N-methylhydantoinase B
LLAPFYWKGSRELLVGNTGHWADVGGAVPGGFSARATEVYQEGVRIPPLKLFDRGRRNDPLIDLLMANMRVPEERLGDLEAQLNALRKGLERLTEVYRRFGAEVVRAGVAELADRCELAMRENIRGLRNGAYRFEDFLDNDGISGTPLRISLELIVRDSELIFDFTDSSPSCKGPLNCPATNTQTAVLIALKHIFPHLAVNEGTFRPVKFVIPQGSFLDARFPCPVSGSAAEVSQRLIDVCFGAFAMISPELAYAQAFSTSSNLSIGGEDPANGRRYVVYAYLGGGLGGHMLGDGLSNATAVHSTARVTPMEVYERRYPFRVRRYGLRPDSAGTGKFRGGAGTVLDIELLRGTATAALLADRSTQGPRGILGGHDGASSVYTFVRSDGSKYIPQLLNKDQDVPMQVGDRVVLETPGGGGFGPPSQREHQKTAEDIVNGLFNPKAACKGFEQTGAIPYEPPTTG